MQSCNCSCVERTYQLECSFSLRFSRRRTSYSIIDFKTNNSFSIQNSFYYSWPHELRRQHETLMPVDRINIDQTRPIWKTGNKGFFFFSKQHALKSTVYLHIIYKLWLPNYPTLSWVSSTATLWVFRIVPKNTASS